MSYIGNRLVQAWAGLNTSVDIRKLLEIQGNRCDSQNSWALESTHLTHSEHVQLFNHQVAPVVQTLDTSTKCQEWVLSWTRY